MSSSPYELNKDTKAAAVSDASNMDTPKRSHKVLPLSEKRHIHIGKIHGSALPTVRKYLLTYIFMCMGVLYVYVACIYACASHVCLMPTDARR